MKKKTKKITIITLLIIVIILIFGLFYILNEKKVYAIPTLKITLNNNSLAKINNNSKNIKYKNNSIEIIDSNSIITKNNVTIKGRGNTTWNWPKKPYQIEFDNETKLLNLGKSNKYILLANYVDETLLRTDIAFYIANKLDMRYTPKSTWVNLYIDNEDLGVYYLTNKIEIGEGSVDLKDDLGIIVELDNMYYYEDEYYITDTFKDHIVIKDVNNKEKSEDAVRLFLDKYNELEEAVKNYNWARIINIIDIESLVKNHIVYGLTWNADAYKSSFYMYMDGKDDKIHFGPVWDFDRSYDNKVNKKVSNLYVKVPDDVKDEKYDQISTMLLELTKSQKFKDEIKSVWNKYMDNCLEDLQNEVMNKYKLLEKYAVRNTKIWNYPRKYKEYVDELLVKIKQAYDNFVVVMNNDYDMMSQK